MYRNKRPRFSGGIQTGYGKSRGSDNYRSLSTGIRRHAFTLGAPNIGSSSTLLPNEYFGYFMARFKRSFSGADGEPTPTASNNYGSHNVMNGSRIQSMDNTITLKNTHATVPATLDIWEIAVSFYDVLIWNTVFPTKCPFDFFLTVNNEGEITTKAVSATLVNDQDILSYKFLQRYMRKVGTITLGNADNDNTAQIKINRIPPKCRRSQTGMAFAYIFGNTSVKNNGATLNIDSSVDWSFEEIPSENRLPYID